MNIWADDDEFLPATPRGPAPGPTDFFAWAVVFALAAGIVFAVMVALARR